MEMNESFKLLYDRVVERTGKSNRPAEIINLISEVTDEEHLARRYYKDMMSSSWDKDGLSGEDDINSQYKCCKSLEELYCPTLPECVDTQLNAIEIELPSNAVRGLNSLTIITECFEGTYSEDELRNNSLGFYKAKINEMEGVQALAVGNTIKIKSECPIEHIEMNYFGIPDSSPQGYNSWIGIGGWKDVIINEVSARILNSIGAHNAGALFTEAARSRKHLRIDNKHKAQ